VSASSELSAPIRDEHQPGQRHRGQLLAHPIQRPAEPRLLSREGELRDVVHALRGGREAERADEEALGQRPEQLAVRRERALDRRGARLVAPVGDLHAARVVHQHADEVALRHRRRDDQRGAEQAERDQRERGAAERDEDGAVHGPRLALHARVRQSRERERGGGEHGGEPRQARRGQQDLAPLEQQRAVLEQELEERLAHRARVRG